MAEFTDKINLRRYLTKGPVIVALLSLGAVAGFAAVGALSSMYHAQQASLGEYWFGRGNEDLVQRRYERAAQEYHVALLYSRDNYGYRLNLAEALVGMGRVDEASTYLNNLWERQPENGLVNLELARIAVRGKDITQAMRFYHNAIYGVWPAAQEGMRRQAGLELINYLLRINAKKQAQAELIALGAALGNEPEQRQQLGDLLLRVQDYTDALSAYRAVLRAQPSNGGALAGAGRAAFELARYVEARRYLEPAAARRPGDTELGDLLKTTQLVLQLDPFRRGVGPVERNRIVMEAFAAAGARLQACLPATGLTQPTGAEQHLRDAWEKMKPRISESGLRRDAALGENAMELVFDIERETRVTCGTPAGADLALLLIAKLHEGS